MFRHGGTWAAWPVWSARGAASLTDCVALNGAVSGTESSSQGISRVGNVLKSEGGSESGNYAWSGMKVNGNTVADDNVEALRMARI